jgi:Flp pilus assembly pilin Flp
MIEAILITVAVIVIGVNVLTTVSTRFRRWVYKKDTK